MASHVSVSSLVLLTYHYSAGRRGGCGSQLLTVESSSAPQQVGFFFLLLHRNELEASVKCLGLKPTGNTEEFQPAAAAKTISAPQSVHFYFICSVCGHRRYIVNKSYNDNKNNQVFILYYLFVPCCTVIFVINCSREVEILAYK